MNTTKESAEQLALRGLLLLLVEVQNLVRANLEGRSHQVWELIGEKAIDTVDDLALLVDAPHAIELVQLARAALASTSPAPAAIPAAAASVHA